MLSLTRTSILTEGGEDQEGQFHKLSFFDESLIAKFFSREVFSMLRHEGFINLELVQKILRWRHTGFNVHTKVRITTKREAERIGKYMIRPLLSLKRLSFDKTEGKVCYQYGKDSSELDRMDYVEFIARVTSHIPDKGQVMVRYYGIYSNAHRGKIRKAGVDSSHPPIIEDEAPFVPSRGWAEMIRKVYETDPLLCPRCGVQMRIISFIENPKVIDKIILHLKLTFQAVRPPPPQIVQQELLTTAEERGEYF
ncbi:MAG: transposase [Candidatus Aminicenantales bacterium]